MATSIKRYALRSEHRHITYKSTFISSAHGVYVMPYASPLAAYMATMHGCMDRRVIRNESRPTYHKAPALSDLTAAMAALTAHLANPEYDQHFAELMNSDFIINKTGAEFNRKSVVRDTNEEYQATITTYQNYTVRPMIEILMLHKAQEIKALLATASEVKRQQFIAAFQKIQLENDEAINFNGFNLDSVSFAGAKLGRSTFDDAVTTNANFDDCDLAETNISQAQLDAAATYHNASLRDGFWLYWDASIKSGLLTRIEDMEKHAALNIPNAHPKYAKVKSLCETYKPLLQNDNPISSHLKLEMFNAFNCKATTDLLAEYRDVKSRAAEICTAIAGLMTGVGLVAYLIALGVQRYRNGYWGVFAKPKTAALAHHVFHHTPVRAGVK